MADIADIQSTFENDFFQLACQDVARIVCILSLDSNDVRKPYSKKSYYTSVYEKCVFLSRFMYMVFIKGFTPTVFDVLPYHLWMLITTLVYIYRLVLLPFWLRFTGYGRFADWSSIGSKQPDKTDPASKPNKVLNLTKETNLANVDFGDPQYEFFLTKLYGFTTHLSPHSQSPGNPFTHVGFPGNFFDHLTGVYKILLAWRQPQYVVRAGLFHSVYGTFDYRYSIFDLRDGRQSLTSLIGPGAEELAFTLCTSDRIGLLRDLMSSMYGAENAKRALRGDSSSGEDGNPYPALIGELTAEGYPVRNHITQVVHILPPDLFAQFAVVFIADFMEQGALGFGSADSDVCLFQFLRYRFFNDLLQFVKPYIRVMPPVWEKYMGKKQFVEATRKEVIAFKRIWKTLMKLFEHYQAKYSDFSARNEARIQGKKPFVFNLSEEDRQTVLRMVQRLPYLAEPKIVLAATIPSGETYEVCVHIVLKFLLISTCVNSEIQSHQVGS